MLLLPVTIVPKTVGAVSGALVTGGTAAVQGMAMLNPQRWSGNNAPAANDVRYSKDLHKHGATLWEAEDDEEVAVTESTKDGIWHHLSYCFLLLTPFRFVMLKSTLKCGRHTSVRSPTLPRHRH